MTKLLILLIGLLIPASKPCLSFFGGYSSDGGTLTQVSPGTVAGTPDSSQVKPGIACLQSLPSLEGKLKFANFFLRSPKITELLPLIPKLSPLLPHLDYLLGREKPVSYLVLLQNNHEMRANGGFFGSYAVVEVSPGMVAGTPDSSQVKPGINIRFQDIYVPDGALVGHVDPPAPIQTAFQQGWFRLRDSDWEPDFPTAAKTIRWFFDKGGEINPDILVTLNLTTIEKIVAIIGETAVPEFNFTLTADNLYTLLQNQSEINFFPGSTQKKNVLTAAGTALTQKLGNLSSSQYLAIAKILLDQLDHSNLLLNSTNPDFQKVVESQNWSGAVNPPGCQTNNCLSDVVLLVEANLGANKANCCIERKTIHTITKGETEITHLINLTFTNTSPLENPLPPRFYGGNYISYLRYYLPENATNIRLTTQPTLPKTLSQYPAPYDGINQKNFDRKFIYGLTEIGFWHLTAAGAKSSVQLSYDLPLDNLGDYPISNYQLTLLKQNGLENSPAEINLFGQTSSTNLETRYSASTPLSN